MDGLASRRREVQRVQERLEREPLRVDRAGECLGDRELGVEVPLRAKYLRTLTAELQRVASHLMGIGFFLQDLGTLGTPLMYAARGEPEALRLLLPGGQGRGLPTAQPTCSRAS